MTIDTGDWVRSYSKGIWQVVRQVPDHYQPRFSLKEPKELYDGPLFMLKRLVNDKWKTSFETETAHASFVKPLTKSDTHKLERFLDDNHGVLAEFNAFDKPVHEILNLGFSLPRRSDYRTFKREFEDAFAEPLPSGMSSDAILKVIAKSQFATSYGKIPRDATLQFVCENHEVKRRHFVYRQLRVHNF